MNRRTYHTLEKLRRVERIFTERHDCSRAQLGKTVISPQRAEASTDRTVHRKDMGNWAALVRMYVHALSGSLSCSCRNSVVGCPSPYDEERWKAQRSLPRRSMNEPWKYEYIDDTNRGSSLSQRPLCCATARLVCNAERNRGGGEER